MNKSIISIIAAIGQNRELGKDNRLLWDIPEDMRRFKKLTTGHPVIMGRKTFESIGKPLPKRLNIIITRNPDYKAEGCVIASSVEDAIYIVEKNNVIASEAKQSQNKDGIASVASLPRNDKKEVFVIGGGQIFEEAIGLADKIYLTIIEQSFPQADTFFPNYSEFSNVVSREDFDNGQYKFSFLELTRPLAT